MGDRRCDGGSADSGSTAPRCANSGGIDDSQDRVRRGSSFRRGSANDRSSHWDACSADEGSSRAQELLGLCSSRTKTPAEQATRKTRLWEAAAIGAVTMEGELEAENKAMLRRLKESIAELEGLVQATVSGADDGAVQHMARFNTGKSFARWRHVSKRRWAAAKQEFNAAQKMKRCKSRMVLARWRRGYGK